MANKKQASKQDSSSSNRLMTLRVRPEKRVPLFEDDGDSNDSDFEELRSTTAAQEEQEDDDNNNEPIPTPKKVTRTKRPNVPVNVLQQQEKLGIESSTKVEQNILRCLDSILLGHRKEVRLAQKAVQNVVVNNSVNNLKVVGADYAGKFSRRITSLAWHQKYPYALACASKFGDIQFLSGARVENNFVRDSNMTFLTKATIEGSGAGGSVTAMKFHNEDLNVLYRSSIDCTVARIDLAVGKTSIYHNTGDYNKWFCSLDVNFERKTIFAGDNKGLVYQFSLDGKLVNEWNFHKDKIHYLEFSKKDPNLLVSTSLDKLNAVKIWDIRSLKKDKMVPLHCLKHNVGVNCARFSPLDGSRLLTSDQLDEIRVYQGPLWMDYLKIKHHHKQFQHITPIKADWHPVNDYIVIGRYPRGDSNPPTRSLRAIEFFDSYSGKFVNAIYPPLDEICSLNAFNPTGEYLATGMNSKLIIWKPSIPMEAGDSETIKADAPKVNLSEATRNQLRGRRAREYSPVGSDDENDANGPATKKKKPSAKGTKTTTKEKTASATNTKTKPSKKKK